MTEPRARLAAFSLPERDLALPDVPSAREQGLDVSFEDWRGIAVPKGTPRAAIAALERAIRETVRSPEFVERCEKLGVHPAFMSSTESGDLMPKEDEELPGLMGLSV